MPNEYLTRINTAIANIQGIDLTNNDAYDRVVAEFRSIRQVPRLLYKIGSGELCFRSRHNLNEDYFTTTNQLRYPELQHVTNYARANKIGQSVFYGSDRRPTSYAEFMEYLARESEIGSEIGMTISVWQVIDDLNLVLVLNPNDTTETEYVQSHLDNYNTLLEDLDEDLREGTTAFYSYVGEKFAEIASENKDVYKITSAYSNLITEGANIDGIIYPSVAFQSRGYNVALKPSVIDDQ
jgi:hypothetical protein